MSRVVLVCLGLSLLAAPGFAQEAKRLPIVIDTDLGSSSDDPFALALAIASPDVELVGVTTVGEGADIRAKMALRMLHAAGRKEVPVAAGTAPQPKMKIGPQYQYYYHPAILYNRAGKPQSQSAADWLHTTLQSRKQPLTIIALGPLTNIARLLKEHPDDHAKIARIVVMGGSLARDYDGAEKAVAEWNIKSDIPAAQAVFTSKISLTVVPLDATWNVKLPEKKLARLLAHKSLLTMQVEALMQMSGEASPVQYDAVALALAIDNKLGTWREARLAIDDDGIMQSSQTGSMALLANKVDPDKFGKWYVDRMVAAGKPSLPRELKNVSKLIEDNRFPTRVHVAEDYETDIEQRWWLTGRLEEKNVGQRKRSFRSQLTLDFDDLQGQLDTMYSAVVFNPVPGPAMGDRTRLKFRYLLTGTDQLRVQLYSLANGYHRYLSLRDLPTGKWQTATVDMTAMRRPDGSGGPLARDERIDDIQFYVDPRGSVLIDEVILYDGAADGEKRPFPRHIVFTGGFDTGKQGVEWPGKYEIVVHEKPRIWKAARSIFSKDGKPELIVSLRGARPLAAREYRLDFDYHLVGSTKPLTVKLRRGNESLTAVLKETKADAWSTATLTFALGERKEMSVDEIEFDLAGHGDSVKLTIDDVLLYEPGE